MCCMSEKEPVDVDLMEEQTGDGFRVTTLRESVQFEGNEAMLASANPNTGRCVVVCDGGCGGKAVWRDISYDEFHDENPGYKLPVARRKMISTLSSK